MSTAKRTASRSAKKKIVTSKDEASTKLKRGEGQKVRTII